MARAMGDPQPSDVRRVRGAPDPATTGRERRGTRPRALHARQRDVEPTRQHISRLVTLAQQNDSEAFGQLYRLHYRRLYSLARFYLPQQAEDVVAETFLRAWEGIHRYRDMGRPFVVWLYAIARHVVADELKAQRRVEPRDKLPDSPSEPEQDDRLMLAIGLEQLPKGQRTVVELRYLMGLSHQEIATVLRKTVGAVKAQRWRALQNLSTIVSR